MLIFFFSSRRRHTRCSRDWSSDVCSSDLEDQHCGVPTLQVPKPYEPWLFLIIVPSPRVHSPIFKLKPSNSWNRPRSLGNSGSRRKTVKAEHQGETIGTKNWHRGSAP